MIADLEARQTALDIGRSLAVAAPAGSGKTSLLVRRVLRLLAVCDRPEEVLAITFTRKAANEMRERILEALRDAQHNAPLNHAHELELREDASAALQRNSQLQWRLLENPSRLKIQTFDSFCRYLARRMALETGSLPPASQLENALPEYRRAVRQLLQSEQSLEFQPVLASLSEQFDGNHDSLVEQFARLLEARADWLELAVADGLNHHRLRDNLTGLIESQLTRCQQALGRAGLLDDLTGLTRYAVSNLSDLPADWISTDFSLDEAVDAASLPRWKVMLDLLLTQSGVRKQITAKIGFPAKKDGGDEAQKARLKKILDQLPDQPELVQEIGYVAALPDLSREIDSLQKLDPLGAFLPRLAAQLQLDFQDRQQTDYTGIAIRALRALGDDDHPTALALRLDYRIRHILVDEFQDTSAIQVQLIERLTAGWQPDDGRTLFVVGDPMQSIYEFRRARVELFIRARSLGIGQVPLEPVDLGCNFRSDPTLVQWVNDQFAGIFPDQDDPFRGQVRYRHSAAVRAPLPDSALTARGFADITAELEQVADSIAKQVSLGDRDIAVLTRKRKDLALLVPLLKARGIPTQMHKVEYLGQRQHVMDLHCLVKALHSNADRIAWLSLLRSPVAGLDNQDLWSLVSQDDPNVQTQPIWHLIMNAGHNQAISEAGQLILAGLKSRLQHGFSQLGQRDLRDLIEQTWRDLGGWQSLLHAHHAKDLEDYLALLEKHACQGLIEDFDRFESDLEKLYARPSGDDSAPVKLMTIHTAKGLEFDTLYLPFLDSGSGNSSKPVLVWRDRITADGARHFYAASKPRRGESCEIYDFLWNEESTRRQDELSRLLYVACTRAKRKLHLSGVVKYNPEKAEWKAPPRGTLLALLWPTMEEQFTPDRVPEESANAGEIPVLSGIRRLAPTRFEQCQTAQVCGLPASAAQLDPQALQTNLEQRALGDLIHEALQALVESGHRPDSDQNEAAWRLALNARGFSDERMENALTRLRDVFRKVEQSEIARWILNPHHEQSACEAEYVLSDGTGGLKRFILDRTFVEQGTRWIIDYKSAEAATGQNLEDFLNAQKEKYRAQLQGYRQLFPDQPVRTALYFPAIDRLEEVEI